MAEQVLTLHDLARMGGVSLAQARRAYERRQLPEPAGKRRFEELGKRSALYWLDTPELRQHVEDLFRPEARKQMEDVMLTASEIARLTGLSRTTIFSYVHKGWLIPDTPSVARQRLGRFRDTPEFREVLAKVGELIRGGLSYPELPQELKEAMKSKTLKA